MQFSNWRKQESVYLSDNLFSIAWENEIQILFSFFVFLCAVNKNEIGFSFSFFDFSPPGRKPYSNSLCVLEKQKTTCNPFSKFQTKLNENEKEKNGKENPFFLRVTGKRKTKNDL